mgnify:CR=1 FL=1
MKKRVLSLLLCFVLAAGLLSVCAPPAQAGTIADAFELFIKQPGQIKKLFGREVAHGDCGPAGDEASVHYKIYEVTNPTVVQDNPFLQQIWQIHDYREDAQYYGVYIFGDGKMADYAATGQKAPWMGNVEVTEYNDKGQVLGTTVVENLGEEYLALAYIADGTDEEWNGRTERYSGVTNVGAYAFKDCRYLTCMFLNDDITTISDSAFYKDEYLSAINMPRRLELVDKYAFYGCDTLTFVRARNCSRLRRIEDHAFYSCTMLAELRLPEGLTYIGPWAFAWDRILGQEDTTLGLPSSLQTISTGAFAFVNHHKNLNIPANVTSIGDFAFMCDYYMNNLTFSPGDKKLTIGKAAFFGDNHMKSVDLSNRVAQIDKCAFAGCEMLEEAYFGDKIDTIEGRAFTSLDNAMKIAVEGVLNGILRPDDTEQNADQAGDISTALNMIAKVTKLKRAVFKNDPAKSIYAAADSNRSFPDDCVVYYPQGSYTWAAELKDDGTWQGYQTGFWHGDHIAAFTDTVVAPTCTEPGHYKGTCPTCGKDYDDVVPALGHDWGEWVTSIEPTVSTVGYRYHVCNRDGCGYREGEDIPKLHTHTWDAGVVTQKPTAAEPGVRTYTCTVCGATKTEVIPATGPHTHVWDEGTVTVAPTETTPGVRTYTCTVCGQTRTEIIPATGSAVCPGGAACPSFRFRDVPAPSNWAHEGIDYCVRHGLMSGFDATTFSPDTVSTRAQIVMILYNLSGDTTDYSKYYVPFTDVRPSTWYYNAVAWGYDKDIVAGMTPTTFAPDGLITREQMAVLLYGYTEKYAPAYLGGAASLNSFPDAASVSNWAYAAMSWAVGNGLISGIASNGADYLAPSGGATRAQIAAIMMRYCRLTGL